MLWTCSRSDMLVEIIIVGQDCYVIDLLGDVLVVNRLDEANQDERVFTQQHILADTRFIHDARRL